MSESFNQLWNLLYRTDLFSIYIDAKDIQTALTAMKNAAGIRCLATAVDSAVTWRNSGSVTVLTLNRPTALNPLTEGICLDVKNKLLDFRKSLDVSCFIVKGNGKAFCAGGDVKELWRALSSTSEVERGASSCS